MAIKDYRFKTADEGKAPIVLIGVLLVCIVIAGGALLFVLTQKGGTNPATQNTGTGQGQTQTGTTTGSGSSTSNQTEGNTTAACDDACLYAIAIGNQTAIDCKGITNAGLKEKCYEQLSNVSLEACKAVTNTTKRAACITTFAVSRKDKEICSLLELQQQMQQCLMAADPCYSASDQNLCNALRSNDSSRCNGEVNCIINYSATTKNVSSCMPIESDAEESACISATTERDRCDELTMQAQKDYCYQLYAIHTNDYLTCLQISSGSSYAVDCIVNFAIKMHNLSTCDDNDRLTLDDKWACYITYALATEDVSGCYRIDELATTNRYKCASQYANKFGDPSACQAIVDSLSQRTTCYQGTIMYSQENLDWRHCANITNFNWENKCFIEAAKLTGNESICDLITTEYAKESCKSAYAANRTNSG